MGKNPYVRFLPTQLRSAASLEEESSRWDWEGHRVHVARARRADSPSRLIVVHGAGGHSGALWPLAAVMASRGYEVAALDLPLYGRTVSPEPERVRYEDWIRLLSDFVRAEDDGRPLVLLGASMGGMLAYEAAAQSRNVTEVIATCLLDPQDPRVLARITRFGPCGRLGGLLAPLVRGPAARRMISIGAVAPLSKMSSNSGLSALCATDPLGGGARVPLGFLASFIRYTHTAPELMRVPITLAHPENDRWTPVDLSLRVLDRVIAPTRHISVRGCGHFPVEEPGVHTLLDAVAERLQRGN